MINARNRKHPDDGWQAALDDMTLRLAAGEPFCHLRFADGEFNAITGNFDAGQSNADGHPYTDDLGAALAAVLQSVARNADSRVVMGGDWSASQLHRTWLEDHELLDRIRWVPSQVFVTGVGSLRSLQFVAKLASLGKAGRLRLVGNRRVAGACGSKLIEVPLSSSWNAVKDVEDRVLALPDRSVILYCAGMPAKIMCHNGWASRPDCTHVDMGHFFDRAYGINSRAWHDDAEPRAQAYDRHFTPVILGSQ